jgi:putative ABC transport system permease protein
VLVSLAAAAAGVLLAHWGVRLLKAWIPDGIPRVADIAIDVRVLGATIAAAVATGALFGIVPAFHVARPDLTGLLSSGGRGSTAGAAVQRLRGALVVVEVALAVILVVGAGLFTASFVKVTRIDPGFDYHGVLAVGVGVTIQPGKIKEALDRGGPYVDRMMDAVRAVPGVEDVAAIYGGLPLSGGRVSNHVTVPGHGTFEGDADDVDTRTITPNYLQMLRVPLVSGRHLTANDRQGAPAVALVNQTAARKYWQGADPLGQRLIIDGKEMVVVGIVGDIRHGGPELPARPEAYMPMAQDRIASATLVIRGPSDPMALLPSVKGAIWSVNRDQMIYTDRVTLDAYMDGLIAQRRFNMALLALFGMLGLVISSVGIYGVMAYIVSQRTKEIGVRMALGASRATVVRMVLANAAGLVAAGLALGGAAAWYLSAAARAFLFQLDARDPRAFAAAVVCLSAAALLAAAIPARRAAGIDPMVALRAE